MRRGRLIVAAACTPLCVGSVACGGVDDEPSPAVVADSSVVVSSPASAVDLAPSQLTASTVARPDGPPPCDPAAISIWTAQVSLTEPSSMATLRLRNDGTTRCELDIGASPAITADVESSVWIDHGEWADLVVWSTSTSASTSTSTGETCTSEVARDVAIAINGSVTNVPTGAVGMCSPALVAFYVQEQPSVVCSELDVAVTDELLLVRNASTRVCELGPLVAVDGAGTGEPDEPAIAVTALVGGDVVAYDVSATGECGVEPVVVTFAAAGAVEVDGLDRCAVVTPGAGRPWFGGRADPLDGVASDDVDAALAALDPFTDV